MIQMIRDAMPWLFGISIVAALAVVLSLGVIYQSPSTEAAQTPVLQDDPNFWPPISPGQFVPFTRSDLRDELLVDPASIGYGCTPGPLPIPCLLTPNQIANLINDPTGPGSDQIDVAFVTANQLTANMVGTDYALLTAPLRDLWDVLLISGAGQSALEVRDSEIRGSALLVWAPGTQTRANLATLQVRQGSRAEVRWGDGTSPTVTDIVAALTDPNIP